MAQLRSLDVRRPTAREDVHRVYAVNPDVSSAQGRCALDDGSAVVCAFETVQVAIEATANDPGLRLVRHQSLNSREQKRVKSALLS